MDRIVTYLSEGSDLFGPFDHRQDAEWFMMAMELFGAKSKGIEILQFALSEKDRDDDNLVLQHNFRTAEASLASSQQNFGSFTIYLDIMNWRLRCC